MPDQVLIDTKPNEVPKIPADYKALGVTWGYDPVAPEDVRLYVVSFGGKGKTTFLSSIPDSLILDFDKHGAQAIPGARAVRITINNYDHYSLFMKKLLDDGKAKRNQYKRISIDPTDMWANMITRQVLLEQKKDHLSEIGRAGKGWDLLKDRLRNTLAELEDAGYTWSCAGHLTTKQITLPNTEKEIMMPWPLLTDKVHQHLVNNCEIYGMICVDSQTKRKKEIVIIEGKEHEIERGQESIEIYSMNCRTVAGKEGKRRGLPDLKAVIELPLYDAWKVFVEEYNIAVQKAKGETR